MIFLEGVLTLVQVRNALGGRERRVADEAIGPEVHDRDLQHVTRRLQTRRGDGVGRRPGNAERLPVERDVRHVAQIAQVNRDGGASWAVGGCVKGLAVDGRAGIVADAGVGVLCPVRERGERDWSWRAAPFRVEGDGPGAGEYEAGRDALLRVRGRAVARPSPGN